MSKAPIEPDFETLFAAAPGLYMVLDPNLRIVAATEAYLRATLTRRADILGRYVFDVFPDNPGDPSADAVRNSTASFRRVLQSHVTDVMGLQRHDVRKPEAEGGGWEARYWNAINSPVLKPDGSLAYIMHHVDNVTELVLLQEQGVKQASVTEALRAQAAQMKAEIAERQRAEAALRESEKRFRSVVENMSEGLMLSMPRAISPTRTPRPYGPMALGLQRLGTSKMRICRRRGKFGTTRGVRCRSRSGPSLGCYEASVSRTRSCAP
jgi:PAS domain-containing protein